MRWIFAFLCFAVWRVSDAQGVGIGTSSPNSSAQLDISSSARGLLIPRMSTAEISSIPSPARGLMVYDTIQDFLMVNIGNANFPNWVNIVAGSGWSLSGNSPTNGRVLGTLDANPLVFVTHGTFAGIIDSGLGSTVTPYTVALGPGVLSQMGQPGGESQAFQCVALGYLALANGGNADVAIGPYASQNNKGEEGIAIGFGALQNNTGLNNIGIGAFASENSTGEDNIAIGRLSGWEVTSGTENTGVGLFSCGATTTGSYNAAFGAYALSANTFGQGNTAVGTYALKNTTQSYYNTAVGYNSGQTYDNGYNNVFVGANDDVNGAGYFNVIAIGQGVVATGSDEALIGNSATGTIGGYADWTNFSDGRYKKNMRENVKGLDFIMRLRPITYHLDVTGIRSHLGQKAPSDAGTRKSIADREAEVFSGFAAQEVEQAASASGYDFNGVKKPQNDNDFYGLRYGEFVVPLVKAMQEQQKMIEELQREVAELKKQIQH